MLPAERIEKVKIYIQQNKYASINELAVIFNTSVPTIRRCLKQLETESVIESVRGGAVYVENHTIVEAPYDIKQKQNLEEKRRIAAEAAKYVTATDCIFLDSSSTVYEMISYVRKIVGLTVATNDVMIANTLSTAHDLSVLVTGGHLRPGYHTLMGNFAESLLKQIRVDYAFMSVDAITNDGRFMITNVEENGIKRAIFDSASKRIILCDHSKFEKTAFISLWDSDQVDLIITGTELSDDLYDHYIKLGFKLVRV